MNKRVENKQKIQMPALPAPTSFEEFFKQFNEFITKSVAKETPEVDPLRQFIEERVGKPPAVLSWERVVKEPHFWAADVRREGTHSGQLHSCSQGNRFSRRVWRSRPFIVGVAVAKNSHSSLLIDQVWEGRAKHQSNSHRPFER